MAGAAVLGRLSWKVCTVVGLRDETATARTIALQVPEWPGTSPASASTCA
jgi:hypothetical protein